MEWIKVSDRLPDTEGFYLVSMKHPLAKQASVASRWFYLYEGKFYNTSLNIDITEYITHWMPLPNPAKDE